MPLLRDDHPAAGTVPSDRARPCRPGPAGDDHARQVRRASAAEPAERALRPRGHRSQCLHARRLGRRLHERAVAAGDVDRRARAGGRAASRRRYHGAGAGQRKDHHRPIVGLCARRSSVRRPGAAGSDLLTTHAIAAGSIRAIISQATRAFFRPTPMPGSTISIMPGRKPGPIIEAACWAHGRRKLFVLADVAKAPLAIEAVRRIDAIFDVEREINGLSAAQRHCDTTGPGRAVGHIARTMDACRTWHALASCRCRQGHGLHAEAMGCVHALPRRWADLPDQQRGGTRAAWHCNARVIVQLLFKYLETLEVDSRWRCDTGALYAQRPPPRTACPGRQRGSGTARRERLARREGCQP